VLVAKVFHLKGKKETFGEEGGERDAKEKV